VIGEARQSRDIYVREAATDRAERLITGKERAAASPLALGRSPASPGASSGNLPLRPLIGYGLSSLWRTASQPAPGAETVYQDMAIGRKSKSSNGALKGRRHRARAMSSFQL
jgi:hypothetical protein